MRSINFVLHNSRGQACGTSWGLTRSFPHSAITHPLVHNSSPNRSQRYPQVMWISLQKIIGVDSTFPHVPQALLLLHTSFNKLKEVVNILFSRNQSIIIGREEEK